MTNGEGEGPGLRAYRRILASPAGALIASAELGRIAFGMSGLAFVVYLQAQTGSFGTAGLAVGAGGVAAGLLAPLRGRMIDRWGRTALLGFTAAYATIDVITALSGPAAGGANYVVLLFLSGMATPPFSAWTRVTLARRVPSADLQSAYTVDGVLEESAFVLGPLIAGGVIATASAQAAILLGAVFVIFSALLLTAAPLLRRWQPQRTAEEREGKMHFTRPLWVTAGTMAALGFAIGAVEVAVTAFAKARGDSAAAGLVISMFSVAGMAGALPYGARRWSLPASRRYLLLAVWMAAGLALLPLAHTVVGLLALIAVPGLALTAFVTTNSLLIERYSIGAPSATAFSLVSATVLLGFSLGTAISGAVVDSHGTDLAFAVAAVGMLVLAAPAVALPSSDEAPRTRG